MAKAVLISINPKWCEKIASGEKTIEVRKTRPKLETPFKVYIYCTIDEPLYQSGEKFWCESAGEFGNGKVIGEFVCDKLVWVLSHPSVFAGHPLLYRQAIDDACLTDEEVEAYSDGKDLYGWHISDLVIYDKPRKLSEFITPTDCNSKIAKDMLCNTCCLSANFCSKRPKRITRPPQSWRYVEEVHNVTENRDSM